MFSFRAQTALLVSALVAATSASARAGDCAAPACCTPATRTVKCIEWVPEKYTCERTVHKVETKEEQYTAYRCEKVPVTKIRTCTYYEMVPEEKTVTRIVCERVPCVVEKTVMCSHTVCKPVTKTVRKCVDKGHWECKCVECKPTLCERIKEWCHRNDCCREPRCPKYKMEKVWVKCPVWEEHTVCCMQRVTECKPITVKCTVYKTVQREEQVKVCCNRCVAKTREETYTCYETKMVPFTATRCVSRCVPHTETVTCCKMVCRVTERQVPCEPCCCEQPKCKKSCFAGLFSRKKDCCD